jgi:Baseplate J-like protein
MATNPIYVETEEEIPELVERLRRYRGDDTMLVLPMRSRIGQSRFNFQLLRNYSAQLGKRVTVVCDDPAVQKMASETGFPVFGAVGPEGEGIPSEAEAPMPIRKWWQRREVAPTTHVGVAAPTRLMTKTATEVKPGRFLLYVTAVTLILVGIFAAAVFVPSASVTLVAQAQPFTTKDVEIQAQPGKAPIHVRATTITSSNSQSFKVTGSINVPLAPATGQVVYSNAIPPPCPGLDCGSPGLVVPYGQRLMNTNGLEFAQSSGNVTVPWATGGQQGTATANVVAVIPGTTGNVGDHTINKIEDNRYPKLTVTNPQATGSGTDPSTTPQMSESDFDAGRAQLEQEIHQTIAQQIQGSGQPGEKLSDTLIFGAPQYTTDHQPGDKVPSFSGTMTITGEGDFYSDADVISAYKTYLSQHVPNNLQLLTSSPTQVQYRLLSSAKGGFLVFVGSASAYVAPTLDEHQIRAAIVGRPTAQARFYLEKLPIRSVAIKEEPLALPLMPLLDRRITLAYVVQSNAPSASAATQGSATPSPSPSHSP